MTKIAIFESDDKQTYELGPEGTVVKSLPAGIYDAVPGPFGRRLIVKVEIETDKLVALEEGNTSKVTNDIEAFLSKETKDAFKDYELLYRRGILLYGPPGTGKTSTVIQICKEFVQHHNGLVFLNFPYGDIGNWVSDLRSQDLNPERPVLLIMEELDNILDRYESTILNLLDGEDSIDNFIVLATTNYIDRIDDRIKNRPSRFSTVMEIGYPSADTRRAFLYSRILPQHKKQVNIEELVSQTDGFSIDHLKDLIVSIFCFRLTPETAISKLRSMIKLGEDPLEDQ